MEEIRTLSEKLTNKLTVNKEYKAKIKIQKAVFNAFTWNEFPLELIRNFTEDCLSKNIWTSEEFFDSKKQNTYNIFDYLINKEYIPIIKSLMIETPPLGSPNAATGEFELMLLLTTDSETPTKGDIRHNKYGLKNLKGNNPRIFTNVRGKYLNQVMKSHLNEYGIELWSQRGVEYGQLLNETAINHYNKQFIEKELSNLNVMDICRIWLNNLFDHEVVDTTFNFIDGNQINWDLWFNFNCLYIFDKCDDKFESFMIMKEDGNVYHLPLNIQDFEKDLMVGKISFSDNYFRLNQDKQCGIYLQVN